MAKAKSKTVSATGLLGLSEILGWSIVETAGGTAAFRILDGGLATPSTPSGALADPPVAGNVNDGEHKIKVTYVTADGETPPSTASAGVTTADKTINGKVLWTIPAASGNNSGRVTARKIYRNTVADGATYKLLATVSDNTTLTYLDNTADAGLGATAPTDNSSGAVIASVKLAASGTSAIGLTNPVGVAGEAFLVVDSGAISGGVHGL